MDVLGMKNTHYNARVFSVFLAVYFSFFGLVAARCTGKETGLGAPDEVYVDAGYELYDRVLSDYVKDGDVDYLMLRESPEGLDKYLLWLAGTDPGKLETSEERLAFWINAYNAFVLKGVLGTLPGRTEDFSGYSVKKTRGFFTRKKYVVDGRSYSLDDIENDVLRSIFKDPRVHFSIVCASESCPILQEKAFRGRDVQARLDETTRNFFTSKDRFRIDRENRIVYLSRIFRWYKEDFEGTEGSLYDFIAEYLESDEDRAFIKRGDFSIKYLDYDWGLNIK
ncbi:MAG: DUF547 domain-containing protein [Candidatus Brocadiales bacterium]